VKDVKEMKGMKKIVGELCRAGHGASRRSDGQPSPAEPAEPGGQIDGIRPRPAFLHAYLGSLL
jgi:hypothetical protein